MRWRGVILRRLSPEEKLRMLEEILSSMPERERKKIESGYYQIVFNPRTKKGWYIRRRPYTYDNPTPAQKIIRAEFAKAASSVFGEKGFAYIDGRPIPKAALAVKEKVKKLPRIRMPILMNKAQLADYRMQIIRKGAPIIPPTREVILTENLTGRQTPATQIFF